MRVETLTFDGTHGWSNVLPSELDSERTVVFAFGAPELLTESRPFRDLELAFPRATTVGCSTAGEIAGASIRDHGLSVAVARFHHTQIVGTAVPVGDVAHSFEVGRALAGRLAAPTLRAIMILSDGLAVNGSELVRGINSAAPAGVVITGGLAGDGQRFQRTWVIDGKWPYAGRVSAVGFYGARINVAHGSKGGWDKFGPERIITRSRANVLLELDGEPALPLYKKYLGDRAAELPAAGLLFPLAIRSANDSAKSLVRTILAVDEREQSMTFAGDMPEGHLAQLMKANFDRLISGASDATSIARSAIRTATSDRLCIAISCVGRRLVLGERAEEELEAVTEALPTGTKQVGFYSYGEISPYASGSCDLHNQTMTLTVLEEGT